MKDRKLITKIHFEKMVRKVLYDVTTYHYDHNAFMAGVIDRAWNLEEAEVKDVTLKLARSQSK